MWKQSSLLQLIKRIRTQDTVTASYYLRSHVDGLWGARMNKVAAVATKDTDFRETEENWRSEKEE